MRFGKRYDFLKQQTAQAILAVYEKKVRHSLPAVMIPTNKPKTSLARWAQRFGCDIVCEKTDPVHVSERKFMDFFLLLEIQVNRSYTNHFEIYNVYNINYIYISHIAIIQINIW